MSEETYQRPLGIGEMIDVFRIERVLGAGGFGITYLATDTTLNCYVAVKEYFPQNAWREQHSRVVRTSEGNASQSFQLGLDRFHREGQTLARFNHPNIVKVRRLLPTNGTAYLVMDYEQGETLESYLQRLGRPLTYQEAELIFNPLLDGLRAVHERDMLHLDIKPSNIFLRSDGIPALIDFGGARHQLGQASRLVSFLVASDGYAPNEQYSGSQLRPATDIYGVAATLYHSVTGRIPADAPLRANAMIDGRPDPLMPASQLLQGSAYPPAFLQAIDSALGMSANSRPQSVREFQQRLFAPVQARPQPQPTPPSQPQRETVYVSPPPQQAQPVRAEVRQSGGTNWMPVLAGVGGVIALLLLVVLIKMPAGSQPSIPSENPIANQTNQSIQNLQEQNALAEAKSQAASLTQQAQEKLAEAEAARQAALDAQQQEQQQLAGQRKDAELNKLASAVSDYYMAIAAGDASKVKMLWKDPNSTKAQKAHDNVAKGGGGVCGIVGENGSHEFNDAFTEARIYMQVECDESHQKRGKQRYTMLFTFEKNYANDWRIIDLKGVK